MYNFTDLNKRGTRDTSMSIQTVFDNKNIDKELTDDTGHFKTLTISGRGILPRRLNTTQVPGHHGLIENGYSYNIREISVKFQIHDKTNTGFRNRINRMNELLVGSERKLEFTDEQAYFEATLAGGDLPEEDSNTLIGTLVFQCSSPAKIKKEHTLNVDTNYNSFDIKGTGSAPWKTKTVLQQNTNQFTFEDNSKMYVELNYQFVKGDVIEIDYKQRKVTVNNNLIVKSVSLQTNWQPLKAGYCQMRASHATELFYNERYY